MVRTRGYGLKTSVLLSVLLLFATMVATAGSETLKESSADAATTQVDINRADEAGLQAIPGIGPALARRIVEFREANGPFSRVEDIMKVRGIGEKSFQKIKSFIKVEPARK